MMFTACLKLFLFVHSSTWCYCVHSLAPPQLAILHSHPMEVQYKYAVSQEMVHWFCPPVKHANERSAANSYAFNSPNKGEGCMTILPVYLLPLLRKSANEIALASSLAKPNSGHCLWAGHRFSIYLALQHGSWPLRICKSKLLWVLQSARVPFRNCNIQTFNNCTNPTANSNLRNCAVRTNCVVNMWPTYVNPKLSLKDVIYILCTGVA